MSETKVTLHQGDCFDIAKTLPPKAFNLIFSDLPYGVTRNTWDTPFDLSAVWDIYTKVALDTATFAFTATQPFATTLICSNKKLFRYDLIWQKTSVTGFLNAPYRPLRTHEHILIFSKKRNTYNPQKVRAAKFSGGNLRDKCKSISNWGDLSKGAKDWRDDGTRFPGSTILIKSERRGDTVHPTQKPVALLEWLIKTYTNEGDSILDPCAGSGTTAIAALNVGNRNVICIEKDPAYFAVMAKRVAEHKEKLRIK